MTTNLGVKVLIDFRLESYAKIEICGTVSRDAGIMKLENTFSNYIYVFVGDLHADALVSQEVVRDVFWSIFLACLAFLAVCSRNFVYILIFERIS